MPAYSPLSHRLRRPPATTYPKPASKMQLSRKLAEKNIWLSRRENCGLNTENPLLQNFQHPQIIRHGQCHEIECPPNYRIRGGTPFLSPSPPCKITTDG